MGIVEYPPKAFHALKRQQLLTLAIALEDQRDRALAENEKLRAQLAAVRDYLVNDTNDDAMHDPYTAQVIRESVLGVLGEPDGGA